MERNTSYLFKTDSLGNLKLISKKPDKDSGGWLIGIIILVLIIAYAILIALILAPLIFTIFGLTILKKSKRFIGGIVSLLTFIYFLVDIKNKMLSKYVFFGYLESSGIFKKPFFNEKWIIIAFYINCIGVLVGTYFILEKYLYFKNKKLLVTEENNYQTNQDENFNPETFKISLNKNNIFIILVWLLSTASILFNIYLNFFDKTYS